MKKYWIVDDISISSAKLIMIKPEDVTDSQILVFSGSSAECKKFLKETHYVRQPLIFWRRQ